MDFLKSFASSFVSVNRMGNDASTQAAPQAESPKPVEPSFLQDTDHTSASGSDNDDMIDRNPATSNSQLASPSTVPRKKGRIKKRNSGGRPAQSLDLEGANQQTLSENSDSEQDIVQNASPTQQSAGKRNSPRSSSNVDTPGYKTRRNKFEESETEDSAYQAEQEGSVSEDMNGVQLSNPPDLYPASTQAESEPAASQAKHKPDEVRYPCPEAATYQCAKTFTTKKSAKRHAQIHLRGQPLSCPTCSKTFSRPENLKAHSLSHTRQEIEQTGPGNDSQRSSIRPEEREDAETSSMNVDQVVQPTALNSGFKSTERTSDVVISENNVLTDVGDGSSTKVSNSSTSVFDEATSTSNSKKKAWTQTRLKRRREPPTSDQAPETASDTSRKRRKVYSFSPPSSVASTEDLDVDIENSTSKTDDTPVQSTSNPKPLTKGNLDGFAKPWTPGSQLYHPIHNPRSPRAGLSRSIQVHIAGLSHGGPSTEKLASSSRPSFRQNSFDSSRSNSMLTPLSTKKDRIHYSSPKGKRRAEDGVIYSSPPIRQEAADGLESTERQGLATSVARRGTNHVPKDQSKKKRDKHNTAEAAIESDVSDDDDGDRPFQCPDCRQRFRTRESLLKHSKRPNVHTNIHQCEVCYKVFQSQERLKVHQQATGHGDGTGYPGKKGTFDDAEVKKLHRWRDRFCTENSINVQTFNQMMTDSCRRVKGFIWPYPFITKQNFLQQYYELLPHRNVRSMRRYRERAFQNVPMKQEWTEEDDEELFQLVNELGPRWVEIGQRMTRTQDSVSQRWRFKVQYGGKLKQGEWGALEVEKLQEAVEQVRQKLHLPLGPEADVRIPWESISKKLKGKRTAQQCSNKWRLLYQIRKGNKFTKPSDVDRKLGNPSRLASPSKMSQRLAGQRTPPNRAGLTPKRRIVSEEFVHDSDDDNDGTQDEQIDDAEPDLELEPDPRSASNSGLESSSDPDPDPESESEPDSQSGSESEPEPASASKSDQSVGSQVEPQRSQVDKVPPPKTPEKRKSLGQTFAQTQVNTSADRSPTPGQRPHTQTEMPTPGIQAQNQPSSSSWRAVNTKSKDQFRNNQDSDQDGDDAIMSNSESSDEEAHEVERSQDNMIDEEASEASTSEDNRSENEGQAESEEEQEAGSQSSSRPASPAASNPVKVSESEADESENDDMIRATHKDSFIQSLQSPSKRSSFNLTADKYSGVKSNMDRSYWQRVLQGGQPPAENSDTDSEDEGDIMHH